MAKNEVYFMYKYKLSKESSDILVKVMSVGIELFDKFEEEWVGILKE